MSRIIKFRFWDGKQMIYNGYDHADMSFNGLLACEGDTIPLEYTGLKDKNGVEIYEGDTVRLKFRDGLSKFSYELGVIKWHQSSSAFKWFAVEEDPSDGNNYWLTHAEADWREVIGNIYENPELLEQK